MKKGKVLIFSAPSGSGKTTIIKHLLNLDFNLHFSISATNRQPRGKEIHGKDYFFLSTEEFQAKIKNQDFLEWEEVYEGRYYGSLKSVVNTKLEQGQNVIFDVDVVGGVNIKKHYQNDALSVFVQTPDLGTLEKRLRSRNTDNETEIKKRLEKAAWEMGFAPKFDYILINNTLEAALNEAEQLVKKFLEL